MQVYEIIDKKKKAIGLSYEEISYMVQGYLDGKIPDYQFSAFLMAIYFTGMTDEELTSLTVVMRDSGDILSHGFIGTRLVDKHSTGGVGDKTSLIVIPIAASAGVKIGKMSGRGLGHTGGTIDKLESIPGFESDLGQDELETILDQVGAFIIGQTGNLAPADKKIYALRDVTATVDSIPLIASSIMSKKLASGSDGLVLDVKVGSGAFMKNLDRGRLLAEKMVAIGKSQKMDTTAIISNMDQPLGRAIGNRLEIREVIECLKGKGPEDLMEISYELAGHMIHLGLGIDLDKARIIAKEQVKSNRAYEKFLEIIQGQSGDISVFDDLDKFSHGEYQLEILAKEEGIISHIDAEKLGLASNMLGAGRDSLDSELDYSAGIYLYKKVGDRVNKGDRLGVLQSSCQDKLKKAQDIFHQAYVYNGEIKDNKVILGVVK